MTSRDDRSHLTRAAFLKSAALGAAGLAFGSQAERALAAPRARAAAGGTLNLYTWEEYFAPSNLSGFKKSTGVHVNIATYDSNDQEYATLLTAAGDKYDITIPSASFIPLMVQHGLLLKLDKSRIPFKYIQKRFLGDESDPHNDYSIPKDYGVIGVLYDPRVVKSPIVTWQDFLDAGAQPGVSGKVQMASVPDDVLGPALWAKNISTNTDDPNQLKAAGKTMTAFNKHVKTYNGFDTDGAVNGTYAMSEMTNGTARLAILQNSHLKFVVPTPQSEIFVDYYTILKHGPNNDAAYEFINYMLQPAQQVAEAAYIGYATVLPDLASRLPKKVPDVQDLIISTPVINRCKQHRVHTNVQQLIETLYTEITSS
jgi:spermidine/putrescine transport system substrate-binding protein